MIKWHGDIDITVLILTSFIIIIHTGGGGGVLSMSRQIEGMNLDPYISLYFVVEV